MIVLASTVVELATNSGFALAGVYSFMFAAFITTLPLLFDIPALIVKFTLLPELLIELL